MPPTDIDEEDLRPLDQDQTRCLILGIDANGVEHVYDKDRNRVVALSREGIDVQYDFDAVEPDKRDWMHYVDDRRGWAKEQWVGYKWAEALAGAHESQR